MDSASPTEGQTYAVLDIETKPDGLAVSLLGRDAGSRTHASAHRIVAACVLVAHDGIDGRWSGFRLETTGEPDMDEPGTLEALDRILLDTARTGPLISFNGLSHDLPVIRRRAARHLMFDVPGIRAMSEMEHVDLMRRMTWGWRDEWPSLKAACAGLGIPITHALSPAGGSGVTGPRRKCETDVACTFLLLLYELAMERGDAGVLLHGWAAFARFLDHPHVQPHLAQFARHDVPRQAIARGFG